MATIPGQGYRRGRLSSGQAPDFFSPSRQHSFRLSSSGRRKVTKQSRNQLAIRPKRVADILRPGTCPSRELRRSRPRTEGLTSCQGGDGRGEVRPEELPWCGGGCLLEKVRRSRGQHAGRLRIFPRAIVASGRGLPSLAAPTRKLPRGGCASGRGSPG